MAGWKNTKYIRNTQSKYKNEKIVTEDGKFDSKREYNHWLALKEQEARGEISFLKRQVKYELVPSQKLPVPIKDKKGKTKKTERAVTYVADFVYIKDGNVIVEDSKGFVTDSYSIKRKLMLQRFGIQIKEV